jgi:hypothetical protein
MATKERLCEYGNCNSTESKVTVNYMGSEPAERPSFCSAEHAAIWLVLRQKFNGPAREATRQLLEEIICGRREPRS